VLLVCVPQAVPDARVGVLRKEHHAGALVELWSSKLQQAELATADISPGGGAAEVPEGASRCAGW
jgi:hypothetical protein